MPSTQKAELSTVMVGLPHTPCYCYSSLEVVTAYDIISSAAASMEGALGMLLPTYCFSTYLCIAIMGGMKEELVGISFIFTLVGEGGS